jgi:flagellar hook-associated protein 1
MSGGITQALLTAQSGLFASQQALDATANNIANVNSPGYSRKVVNMEQRVVVGVGVGVQVSDITRQVDEGLLKSLRLELSDTNVLSVKEDFFQRVQDIFGTPEANSSISHVINEFTASLETLAVSPDKSLEQSDLVRWGKEVTLKLQDMSKTVQELRLQADEDIAAVVTEINKLVTRIGGLNDTLIKNATTNRDVTDLQDQRDQSIDRLAELVDIRYFFRADGDVVVFTSDGRTLVDNVPATMTHDKASSVTATTTHAEGDFGGIFVGRAIAGNDITNEVRSGQLKGLVEMRDNILTGLQSQLDELAANMRDTFNQIHNRGTAYPGLQTMTGTRNFIDPSNSVADVVGQAFRFDPSNGSDTRILLFDQSGNQAASVSLSTLMTDTNFGGHGPSYNNADGIGVGYAAGDFWTITDVASVLQNWMNDAPPGAGGSIAGSGLGLNSAVTIDSAGHFSIDLNSTTYSLAFRDESTVNTPGSTHTDATIQFNATGVGGSNVGAAGIDETALGFSNFLGLSDFFSDGLPDSVYESDIVSSTFGATAATLTFRNATGALTGSPLAITAGTSITDLAAQITNSVTGATASVVPDGSGVRLRIVSDNGGSLVFTDDAAGGETLLTDLGMHIADVRVATALSVRSDIEITPGRISRGAVQWDAGLGAAGEYFTSPGDGSIVTALAEQFTTTNSFKAAGGIAGLSTSFSGYAAAILSTNADLADTNDANLKTQALLTDSLQLKSDTFRGVNLDEEMANLILFEQSYVAAARVATVIQKMFDALERIL